MKFFVLLFLSLFLMQSAFANDFSKKKIIKIESEDEFNIIDLDQKVKSPKLDEQKAVFDSSTLRTFNKDSEVDFGILVGFRENFGYSLDKLNIKAKDFSNEFTQRFIKDLKLRLISAGANRMYQAERILNFSNPKKNFKLVDISKFLRQDKTPTQFTDYVVAVSLDEFYVETTDLLFMKLKNAYAIINIKFISTSTNKIISSKNVDLRVRLDYENSRQNYQSVISQMPTMLAEVINKEGKKLKVEK
ncbi:MAG: hypothetical protein J1D99_00525 [Campylobacter sp.]|nr:hypothetical protein [Campylobacter sp.]